MRVYLCLSVLYILESRAALRAASILRGTRQKSGRGNSMEAYYFGARTVGQRESARAEATLWYTGQARNVMLARTNGSELGTTPQTFDVWNI